MLKQPRDERRDGQKLSPRCMARIGRLTGTLDVHKVRVGSLHETLLLVSLLLGENGGVEQVLDKLHHHKAQVSFTSGHSQRAPSASLPPKRAGQAVRLGALPTAEQLMDGRRG